MVRRTRIELVYKVHVKHPLNASQPATHNLVDPDGYDPSPLVCKTRMLPLSLGALGTANGIRTHIFRLKVGCDGQLRYGCVVRLRCFDHLSFAYQAKVLPLNYKRKKPRLLQRGLVFFW